MAFTSTPLQNSRLKSQGSFLDVFGQRLNSQRLVLQCLRRILQVEGVRRFCLANKTPQNLQVSPSLLSPCSSFPPPRPFSALLRPARASRFWGGKGHKDLWEKGMAKGAMKASGSMEGQSECFYPRTDLHEDQWGRSM